MNIVEPRQLRMWKSPWSERKNHRTGMFVVLRFQHDVVWYFDFVRNEMACNVYAILCERSELVSEVDSEAR